MTIDLSTCLEGELWHLARVRGKDVQSLVEEAIRQYLDGEAISDVIAEDVAATQASLLSELGDIPAWFEGPEPTEDEAR